MDDKPITTDDLYGKSEPSTSNPLTPQSEQVINPASAPLRYEETPIIEPIIEESTSVAAPQMPPPPSHPAMPSSGHSSVPKKPSNILQTVGTILFFVLLFGLGVWLSTLLRQYLPNGLPQVSLPGATQQVTPTEMPSQQVSPTNADPFAQWGLYQVTSAASKAVVPGVSYKLPPTVEFPICDGANCASQGTYLPGGTRFTVAVRGLGQLLGDYRGAVVTDVAGREFTTVPTTIGGRPALMFQGLFAGTTTGGYAFSQMRGVMIQIDDKLSLELNHFTPNGVNADFAADDSIFDKILDSLILGPSVGEKGGTVVTPSGTPQVP